MTKKVTKQLRQTRYRKARQAERREREVLTKFLTERRFLRVSPKRAAAMPIEALRREARSYASWPLMRRPQGLVLLPLS